MHKIYKTHILLLGIIAALLIILVFKNTANYAIAQGDGNVRHVFGVAGEKQGNRQH